MIRRPPRSTQSRSSAASDVYKRQHGGCVIEPDMGDMAVEAVRRAKIRVREEEDRQKAALIAAAEKVKQDARDAEAAKEALNRKKADEVIEALKVSAPEVKIFESELDMATKEMPSQAQVEWQRQELLSSEKRMSKIKKVRDSYLSQYGKTLSKAKQEVTDANAEKAGAEKALKKAQQDLDMEDAKNAYKGDLMKLPVKVVAGAPGRLGEASGDERHHLLALDSTTSTMIENLVAQRRKAVSYTHLRAHETVLDLVCRLLLEKKKKNRQ
eukprot:TRINITY_DN27171_c0_g1_i1.p1 TRINITY_DN27171_c0_g1~~TRINITY_DN27171_c0_g1_i1.p1  ORF type:complete len:269 (-),score=147.71 TRINITY_DN27171_c0_g1_i1:112-918(-)